MCGRYFLKSSPESLARKFGLFGPVLNFPARYNIAPTQDVPLIRERGGVRELVFMRWGLVPEWSRDGPQSKPLINARSETVNEKPSFRSAFRRGRGLLPADGFYEWQRPDGGPKRPFNIHMTDGSPFAMAAVWDTWTAPDGSIVQSCAIVTTSANKVLEPIHHRMPVILSEDAWAAWLGTPADQAESLLPLLRPAPDDWMVADPITDKVNKVAHDGPDLIRPLIAGESAEDQGSLF